MELKKMSMTMTTKENLKHFLGAGCMIGLLVWWIHGISTQQDENKKREEQQKITVQIWNSPEEIAMIENGFHRVEDQSKDQEAFQSEVWQNNLNDCVYKIKAKKNLMLIKPLKVGYRQQEGEYDAPIQSMTGGETWKGGFLSAAPNWITNKNQESIKKITLVHESGNRMIADTIECPKPKPKMN